MKDYKVQKGTTVAPEQYRITIMTDGPYLVYGKPVLKQQFLMPDDKGNCWYYKAGKSFPLPEEPTAVCRCGASKNKPYCDGSHVTADWDSRLTASHEPLLAGAELMEGPRINLTDNESFCAFARVCDAKGRVWNLVEVDSEEAKEIVIHEANHCPAGRLSAWNKETGEPYEPELKPALGLIEDPLIRCSAALWVTGGIPISKEDGTTYEVRNRVTLCRCGESSNKPYCDGTHASVKFRDGIGGDPEGEEF